MNSKDVIDSDSESFAPSNTRMLLVNEDCGTSDAIVQPIKKILKIEIIFSSDLVTFKLFIHYVNVMCLCLM